jgi:predicted RNA-binding protein associated with RNAse of E/G family
MRFGERVVLADKDYYWLEIALENENYWLTAMFNPDGEFVQYYFDQEL